MKLIFKKAAAALLIATASALPALALFAAVLFFPTYTCGGQGSGGNCGEGYLASIPFAVLLIPVDIFVAIVVGKGLARSIWPDDDTTSAVFPVLLVLAVFAAISYRLVEIWIQPSVVTYHYRLTLYIDTPEGPRVGSNVLAVKTTLEKGGTSFQSLEGEATRVDLGARGALFALLIADRYREGQDRTGENYFIADHAIAFPHPKSEMGFENEYREAIAKLEKSKTSFDIDLKYAPMLVHFDDPNRQESVKRVEPFKLNEAFGDGVTLTRITLEVTDSPVDHKLSAWLPWLKGNNSNAFLFASDPRWQSGAAFTPVDRLTYNDFRSAPR